MANVSVHTRESELLLETHRPDRRHVNHFDSLVEFHEGFKHILIVKDDTPLYASLSCF